MPIDKPWTEWDPTVDYRTLPGAMGIYEVADADQRLLYIGKAGGRSPFGLRGELFRIFASAEVLAEANWIHPQMGSRLPSLQDAKYYRYEVNHQYYGRWLSALMAYQAELDELPAGNREDPEEPPPFLATTRRSTAS